MDLSVSAVCLETQRKVPQEDQVYKVQEVKKEETGCQEPRVYQGSKVTKEDQEDNVQSVVMDKKETRVIMVKTEEMGFQGSQDCKGVLGYLA